MVFGSIFGAPAFLHILAAVATFVWSLAPIVRWREKVTAKTHSDLLVFAREAVRRTYEEWVRATKAANADGKLTSDERAEARRMALSTLARLVAGKAREELDERLGAGTAESLIEEAVRLEKGVAF